MRETIIAQGVCWPAKIKTLSRGSIDGVDAVQRFNPARFGDDTKRAIRERFGIPQGARVVGFVGRVLPDKGIAELLTAWRTLRQKFADARLLIVGGLDPREKLPESVENGLRTEPGILWPGFLKDPAPAYSIMDMLVLPSYHEGFPVVLLEGSAMALPIVATDIPGCVDAVVNGVTGTLVPVGDAHCLANAIAAYLNDGSLRRRHGQAGRARVMGDFRPEVVREHLYREYLELLRQRRLVAV